MNLTNIRCNAGEVKRLRDATRFQQIKKVLSAFMGRDFDTEVFVTAAQFSNICRSKGVQGSINDLKICACSVLWKMPILSKDKDYKHYQERLPIELLAPRFGS